MVIFLNSVNFQTIGAQFTKVFNDYREAFVELLPNLTIAVVVFLLFFGLGKLFYSVIHRRIQKRWKDTIAGGIIASSFKWLFYLLGIFSALSILGFSKVASGLVAGAGVSAFIIGFAFKDIAENFLAGLLLAFSRPFNLRDIIEINGMKGTVSALNLRTTQIRTLDGRDIFIPNGTIIKTELTNFTKDGLLRYDFVLGLDTDSDIENARKLILAELDTYKEIGVLKSPPVAVNVEQVGVSTIDLRIFFWVDAFKSKVYDPMLEGEFVKSRVIRGVAKMLLDNNYSLPSTILEHKIYDKNDPIPVKVLGDK